MWQEKVGSSGAAAGSAVGTLGAMRIADVLMAACLLGGMAAAHASESPADAPLSSCDAYIQHGAPEAGRACVATLAEREAALNARERRLLDQPPEGSLAAVVRDVLRAQRLLEEELRTLEAELGAREVRFRSFLKQCVTIWQEERARRARERATAAAGGAGTGRTRAVGAGGSAGGRTGSSTRGTAGAGSAARTAAGRRAPTDRRLARSVRQDAARSTDTRHGHRKTRSAAGVPRSRGNGPVVLVLDVSNSMNEPFGGGIKFDVMHAAARLLVASLDDGRPVGLTIFGTGPDCGAVRTLVRPARGALASVRSTLQGLRANPMGNTPLTAGLEAAIRSAGKGREITVLLLSDGGEACMNDPVSMLLRLKAEGYRFRIHAVTFERMYAPRVIMATIANVGRGRFVQFRPGDDIRRRLARLLDELRR